jgi:hypothetical protein
MHRNLSTRPPLAAAFTGTADRHYSQRHPDTCVSRILINEVAAASYADNSASCARCRLSPSQRSSIPPPRHPEQSPNTSGDGDSEDGGRGLISMTCPECVSCTLNLTRHSNNLQSTIRNTQHLKLSALRLPPTLCIWFTGLLVPDSKTVHPVS